MRFFLIVDLLIIKHFPFLVKNFPFLGKFFLKWFFFNFPFLGKFFLKRLFRAVDDRRKFESGRVIWRGSRKILKNPEIAGRHAAMKVINNEMTHKYSWKCYRTDLTLVSCRLRG